ncbi:hypothetical protein WDL1CHR_05849 [Variovorax sp. WDL1]|nr:hypothetical protein CHC06_07874 [Variovorax sp. B2]PNG47825.1 hypothetical protein CHC07_06994 [Variovorax sp. B4]VTV15442.1 hypothetical protein WDL1CHR_05849 [Variovorax sp. WDL1]
MVEALRRPCARRAGRPRAGLQPEHRRRSGQLHASPGGGARAARRAVPLGLGRRQRDPLRRAQQLAEHRHQRRTAGRLGARCLGPAAPGSRWCPGQRRGQRGRPGLGALVGGGRACDQLLLTARGRCRAAAAGGHAGGLPAQPGDCAQPLQRRHRGADRRVAGADALRQHAGRARGAEAQPRHAGARDRGAGRRCAGRLQPARGRLDPHRARHTRRRAFDAAAAPARHRRVGARGGGGQCTDRHRAHGLLSELQPERRAQQQREPRGRSVQRLEHVVVAGPVGGADGVRRRRHRRPGRAGEGGARGSSSALPPDRAHRLPGRRGPAHRGREPRAAGRPAARGLGCGGSQRAAVPQSLPPGAGELHRRGVGAGAGAQCAADGAAVAGEPAECGRGVDPGVGRRLAGGVDGDGGGARWFLLGLPFRRRGARPRAAAGRGACRYDPSSEGIREHWP